MPDQTTGPCGWCHALNLTSVHFCERCGHEAHVARMRCRCLACTARPGQLTQPIQCRRCGAFIAWVSVATRGSLENPTGARERQTLAEFLLRLTDDENRHIALCARCRHPT